MCGIVGYIGREQAAPILLKGLKRLEYRGYDSAGVAILTENGTRVERAPGRLADLAAKLEALPQSLLRGTVGIAHTRWATHGAPTEANAHPHRARGVTLVHNGIIENAHEEKERLEKEGIVFSSETDTEVIAWRIALAYRGDARAAIAEGISALRGTWALGVLFDDQPDCLWVLRKDSPLYVGLGEGETVAASDLSALPGGIGRYLIPEEGMIACLTETGATVYDEQGTDITDRVPIHQVLIRQEDAELGQYPHFMRKEIAEEPGVLKKLFDKHLSGEPEEIFGKELPDCGGITGLHMVGCGSAMHAAMLGGGWIERFARIPVRVHVASEFRYADPIIGQGERVVVLSQSGETADSLAALRLVKSRGIPVWGIVNVPGSTMTREADTVFYTEAGPEIAVATTKAYLAQTAVLAMLAIRLGFENGRLSRDAAKARMSDLRAMKEVCAQMEDCFPALSRLAAEWHEAEHCFFLGRGQDYALSMEGALKLKEISYIHCEAYPSGELKHGTISLITDGVPCLVCATDPALFEKTLSGAKEVKARGAKVIMIVGYDETGEPFHVPADVADSVLTLPVAASWFLPMAGVIAMQYFAYCVALLRGCDVDKPRNLAKSVTVE